MIYSVRNGFLGNDLIEAIVEADSKEEAIDLAAPAFKSYGGTNDPASWTPNERWSVDQIELPYVVGG